MKKIALAVLVSTFTFITFAGDYAVETSVPVTETQVVSNNVAITTARVESINVILSEPPRFVLRISLKDSSGTIISRKTAVLTQAQIATMMPSIEQVMAGGRVAMSNNIETIISVAK